MTLHPSLKFLILLTSGCLGALLIWKTTQSMTPEASSTSPAPEKTTASETEHRKEPQSADLERNVEAITPNELTEEKELLMWSSKSMPVHIPIEHEKGRNPKMVPSSKALIFHTDTFLGPEPTPTPEPSPTPVTP